MTGPEHYGEAEYWLRIATCGGGEPDGPDAGETRLSAAIAQVHATLALTAAAAVHDGYTGAQAWQDAAGTPAAHATARGRS